MILSLINRAEGKRGGEVIHDRLHSFLVRKYGCVVPPRIGTLSRENNNPVRHAVNNLRLVKKHEPGLLIVDISSGIRDVLAVRAMKTRRRHVLTLSMGRRMDFRYNLKPIEYVVRACERYVLRNADVILTLSRYGSRMVEKVASEKARIIVARPGLEVRQLELPGIKSSFESESLSRLLFVGECTKVKGLIYLIQSMAFLDDLNVKLDIAGDYSSRGKYYRSIERFVGEKNLRDRIEFHGFLRRSELDVLYRGSSIFVLPSLSEGYGMVLAEALCFGLPIVATRAGAIPELVDDGVNAFLVEPGDSIALAAAIRKLATDPELRLKMSKANLERAKTIPRWEDYERVLDNELVPAIEKLTGLRRLDSKT
jgi:glycosyltransferase involved in cell wall biosynthesis